MRRYLIVFVIVLICQMVNGQIKENGDFDIIMSGNGSTIEEAVRDCKLKVCSVVYYDPQGNAPFLKYIKDCDTIITDYLDQKINRWFVVTRITMNISSISTCNGKRRFIAERIVREILSKTERACCDRLAYRLGEIALLPIAHKIDVARDEGELFYVNVSAHIPFLERVKRLYDTVIDNIKVPEDEINKVYENDEEKFVYYYYVGQKTSFYRETDDWGEPRLAYDDKIPNPWDRSEIVVRNGKDTYHNLYKNFGDNLLINLWSYRIKVGETNEVYAPRILGKRLKDGRVNKYYIKFGERTISYPIYYNFPEEYVMTGFLPIVHEGELRLVVDPKQREETLKEWKRKEAL